MDLDSPVVDNEVEVSHRPNATCSPIPGVRVHFAGGGANPVATTFIDDRLEDLPAD